MPLIISLNGTDVKVIESIQFKHDRVIGALVDKMEFMMVKLQNKMREKTKGRVAEAIRNPRAYVEGGRITGAIDAGGDPTTVSYKGGKSFDITRILNEGAIPHRIDPLLQATGLTGPGQPRGGTRKHGKGEVRRFGSNVLSFFSRNVGKQVFASALYGKSQHPGITGAHFIENSVNEMRKEISEGLRQTLNDIMTGGR